MTRASAKSTGAPAIAVEQVAEWFREAVNGKRAKMPGPEAIQAAAQALNFMKSHPTQDEETFESQAGRYGRLFLRHADKERGAVLRHLEALDEALAFHGHSVTPAIARQGAELIDGAIGAVTAFLDFAGRYSAPEPATWHDTAIVIRHVAAKAWKTTGKVPRSSDPAGAMVGFVAGALKAFGTDVGREAVKDALRGRRGHGLLVPAKAPKGTRRKKK